MPNLVVYIPVRLERHLQPMTKEEMRVVCIKALEDQTRPLKAIASHRPYSEHRLHRCD